MKKVGLLIQRIKVKRFDFNFKTNIEKSNMAYSSRAFDDLFIAVENKSYSTSLSSDNLIFDVQNKFKNQKIDSEKIYEGMYVYNGIWYESHIYNSRVFLKSITDIPTANIIQKYYKHFLDYRMLVSSIFGSHKLEVKSKISDKLSNLKSDSANFKDKQEKMTEESNLLSIKQRNTFEATNNFKKLNIIYALLRMEISKELKKIEGIYYLASKNILNISEKDFSKFKFIWSNLSAKRKDNILESLDLDRKEVDENKQKIIKTLNINDFNDIYQIFKVQLTVLHNNLVNKNAIDAVNISNLIYHEILIMKNGKLE